MSGRDVFTIVGAAVSTELVILITSGVVHLFTR